MTRRLEGVILYMATTSKLIDTQECSSGWLAMTSALLVIRRATSASNSKKGAAGGGERVVSVLLPCNRLTESNLDTKSFANTQTQTIVPEAQVKVLECPSD